MSWITESLRLTAFATPPLPEQVQWWREVVGQDPEDAGVTKRGGVVQVRQSGPFKTGKLSLEVHMDRIDWKFIPDPAQESEVFSSIGPFGEALEAFSAPMSRWLPLAPPLKRLALGLILLEPVENLAQGYRRLGQLLPAVRFEPGSSDFNYQINRPRPSSIVPGLTINRLSKWSVASVHIQQIAVGPQGVQSATIAEQGYACRVELDVNTIRSQELPAGSLAALFEELRSFSVEVAEHGDIP